MPRGKILSNSVKELEFELAKQKAVLKEFPGAKINSVGFQSKEVNQNYSSFDFIRRRGHGVWVVTHSEVSFEHEGKTEKVKVHSVPRTSRLAYIQWDRKERKYVLKFSRFSLNMRTNAFKEDMFNSCRAEVMTFIKENPGIQMDDKHLEERLKKLLIFT
jgi:hypothetical protein